MNARLSWSFHRDSNQRPRKVRLHSKCGPVVHLAHGRTPRNTAQVKAFFQCCRILFSNDPELPGNNELSFAPYLHILYLVLLLGNLYHKNIDSFQQYWDKVDRYKRYSCCTR